MPDGTAPPSQARSARPAQRFASPLSGARPSVRGSGLEQRLCNAADLGLAAEQYRRGKTNPMAMSVGKEDGDDVPMSDINTTPLVDVMLVLLIIFLIAIPVAIQSVQLELPKVAFQPTLTKPENVLLAVRASPDGKCEVYWGMAPISSGDLLKKGESKANVMLSPGDVIIIPESMF